VRGLRKEGKEKRALLTSQHFLCLREGELKGGGIFDFLHAGAKNKIKTFFFGGGGGGGLHSIWWFCPCLLDHFTFLRNFIPGFISFHYLILCSSWF
jgi:hypothetical protein